MNGSHLVPVVAVLLAVPPVLGGEVEAGDESNHRQTGPLQSQWPVASRAGANDFADGPQPGTSRPASPPVEPFSPDRLKQLMRPIFDFDAQWYAEADQIQLTTLGGRVKIPTYPIFGPPPPFVGLGLQYTNIDAPAALDLPAELYTTSLDLSWMRPINDRWMLRSMLGIANATDGRNHSSDAWQFRGGAFAIFRPNERWTWTIGALALGRRDIPVVPAVGLIYQPNRFARFDLTFPRPRASFLVADHGDRQQWAYLGAGLSGGTWGYRGAAGIDDQITYRVWQLILGWESTPRLQPGMPFARGRRFAVETGYAFARQFEFEGGRPDIDIADTVMLRATMSF